MATIRVDGTPEPAGSKSAFPYRKGGGKLGVRVVDGNPKAKAWQRQVQRAAAEQYDGLMMTGPIHLSLHFVFARPKSHFSRGGKLKRDAPRQHTTKPDALKLARAVEDALTGVIYLDDAQIITEYITKRYGEYSRVLISVSDEVRDDEAETATTKAEATTYPA